MKSITAILLLTSYLGLFVRAQNAADPDAAKVAVSYLKMLTDNQYDLNENTAISSNCEISRRKEIREELEFYRKTRLHENDQYTLEKQKIKGNFSALLLRAENPSTPLRTRIHSIAMLMKDGKWLPAPLPGTYSNTGYGYDPNVEKTVKELEKWMAREKISRETSARKSASDEILEGITRELQNSKLTNIAPQQSAQKLIKAIRSKNILKALAITGVTTKQLAEPLETSVESMSRGITRDDSENEWLLITRKSAIFQVLKLDKTKKEVIIGFWDPLAKTPDKIIYFPYYVHDSKTFTKIPEILKVALLSKDERWRQRWRHRRNDDTILLKKLPEELFKNNQAVTYQEAQKVFEEIIHSYQREDFSQLLSLLPREHEYFNQQEIQKQLLKEISQTWRQLYSAKSNPMRVLNIFEEENTALAALQFANTNRPGEFTTIQIWMLKSNDNWHLVTKNTLIDHGGKEIERSMTKLEKRMKNVQKEHQEKHSRELMDKVVHVTLPLQLNAPSSEEALATVKQFRQMLRKKDTTSALSLCAVLEGTSHKETLKIFNYAIRGAVDHHDNDEILGVHQSGKWTGISVRTSSKASDLVDYPLYLTVNTPNGNKIILDVDLRHPTNRGRELINSRTWRKITKILPDEPLSELKEIFKLHEKSSSADIKKNNPQEENE